MRRGGGDLPRRVGDAHGLFLDLHRVARPGELRLERGRHGASRGEHRLEVVGQEHVTTERHVLERLGGPKEALALRVERLPRLHAPAPLVGARRRRAERVDEHREDLARRFDASKLFARRDGPLEQVGQVAGPGGVIRRLEEERVAEQASPRRHARPGDPGTLSRLRPLQDAVSLARFRLGLVDARLREGLGRVASLEHGRVVEQALGVALESLEHAQRLERVVDVAIELRRARAELARSTFARAFSQRRALGHARDANGAGLFDDDVAPAPIVRAARALVAPVPCPRVLPSTLAGDRAGGDEPHGDGLARPAGELAGRGARIVDDERLRERTERGFHLGRRGHVELLEAGREELGIELVAKAQELGRDRRARDVERARFAKVLLALSLAFGQVRPCGLDLACEAMTEVRHGIARSSGRVERALETSGEAGRLAPAAHALLELLAAASRLDLRAPCFERPPLGGARVVFGAAESGLRLREALLDDRRRGRRDLREPQLRSPCANPGLALAELLGARTIERELCAPLSRPVELCEASQRSSRPRVRIDGLGPVGPGVLGGLWIRGRLASSAAQARAYSSRHTAAEDSTSRSRRGRSASISSRRARTRCSAASMPCGSRVGWASRAFA